jgi:NitT/TauT family transport system permease protein
METLQLLAMGFAIAAILGVSVGLILGRVKVLDQALSPWANGLYAAPLPAIVPVITAAVGFGLGAKMIIVVMIGVFPILLNTYQGVAETDKGLIEVARSFRSSESQMWRNVLLPFAMPFILVGLRLGIVRCLIGTVVAEFFTSPGGLGYQIITYSRRFDIAATLVPVLALTLLGLGLFGAVRLAEKTLTPWHEKS